MTTPRLILSFIFFFFNDTQKPMDVFTVCFFRFVFVFIYYFSLRCLVECVYRSALRRFLYFFFFFFFICIYIFVRLFRYDSGMPPQSQKKKCHTTDRFLTVLLFVIALSAKNRLSFLFFYSDFFSFFFILAHCQSRRGLRDEQTEDESRETCRTDKRGERERERERNEKLDAENGTKCKRERAA